MKWVNLIKILTFKFSMSKLHIFLLQGYRFRRSRTKPQEFSDEQKLERYTFALNMRIQDKSKLVCVDESSMQTFRYSIYHNRLISSTPHANCTYMRNVETIHMWVGLSFFGCSPCAVIFAFITFSYF